MLQSAGNPRQRLLGGLRMLVTSHCGSVRMPAIAVPGTLAFGLARNSSKVSALQVTPYFFRFSLGPKRLCVVPALRPTTPTRLGPTFELSSLVTPWQAGQPLAMNSSLPLAASPLASLA